VNKGLITKRKRKHNNTPWPEFDKNTLERERKWPWLLLSLFLTLFIHLLLGIFFEGYTFKQAKPTPPAQELELVLLPKEEPEMKFVETNPDVASNEPDDTKNYAARSQQAAQELPENGESILPRLEGKERDSQALIESQTMMEPTPPMPQAQVAQNEPAKEVQKEEENAPEGKPGEKIADFMEQPKVSLEKDGTIVLKSDQEAKPVAEKKAEKKAISEIRPQPRPTLRKAGVPAPLLLSEKGSAPQGMIAADAKFSQFGQYEQQMLEAIVYQWHMLANRLTFSSQDINSVVVLSFNLDKAGNVSNVTIETSTASSMATLICKDAVQSRAPYGPWPPDMIKILGDQQHIRFTFHYQ